MARCTKSVVETVGFVSLVGAPAPALVSQESDPVATAQKAFADMAKDPEN